MSSSALSPWHSVCVTCVRGGQRFVGGYRAFLLAPSTIFTLVSLLLLIVAVMVTPDGLINMESA